MFSSYVRSRYFWVSPSGRNTKKSQGVFATRCYAGSAAALGVCFDGLPPPGCIS